MSNYLWYLTEKRKRLIEELGKIPDKKSLSEILEESLESYIKIHGAGNPAYSLDKFQDPEFKITPAFGENMLKWQNFISKCNRQELDEIMQKCEIIEKNARNQFHQV